MYFDSYRVYLLSGVSSVGRRLIGASQSSWTSSPSAESSGCASLTISGKSSVTAEGSLEIRSS